LVSSKAVKCGPRAAFVTVLGDALRTGTQIVIAVLGLQLLVSVAEDILPYMQILGGLYIIYIGYMSFIENTHENDVPQTRRNEAGHFWAGFLVCVSNPKSIIFFVALFPGFISQDLSVLLQSVVYGTVFVSLDAMFIMGYSFVAIGAFKSRLGNNISVSKVSGIGLSIVGLLLFWSGCSLVFGT